MADAKKLIYLVDDDLTNLTIGANTLNGCYNVVTFNSGARLLGALERRVPDLILLDVAMPEMNGYETIRLIKQNQSFANIPVIFLTAKSDDSSELEGLSLGAVDYISKPFSPPLLLKRIELHLLIEEQKKDLKDFNLNLQNMVAEKTKTVVELQNAVLSMMAELVECRDDTTGGHIERTQTYLRILINKMCETKLYWDEVSVWDIDLLLQSAQLHDVGKIAVPDSVLKKPGKLTADEFEQIKIHTTFGVEVIEKIMSRTSNCEFLELARVMVYTHHERWDGSGYPNGFAGDNIPLLGRLMAVVDVYDALVSDRPYKIAFTHQKAVETIRNDSGTHFDPALVELFMSVTDEFAKVMNSYK